jgi:elongation factor Ts
MVEGRVNKYKAEVSMTEQPFVKDGNVKVKDLLKEAGASLETMIRFEVGEGIEKEETDFAARNERFIAWVQRVADQAFEAGTDDVAALLEAGLEGEREALVQEIGENITVRRIARVTGARVAAYVHADNRKGALVGLSAGDEALGKDLAMHAVALNPKVATPEALDPADLAKEREIYEAQAAESGKPAEIVAKMVEGRVNKYKAEVSMTEQPFVKDGNVKVKDLLKDAGATLETMIRFEVGEGIEKEETDFAAEVAAQIRGEA